MALIVFLFEALSMIINIFIQQCKFTVTDKKRVSAFMYVGAFSMSIYPRFFND